ncbi:hypothetical protein [Enhydrobacter sp.]|uniref:hypothetical protein n=1 Tax=Enhydrobacter sp. TaxID=1894999 RepID=UPI002630A10E|nr:hypothetical protein [Enhydrobacter sp.]WIM09071.1 MAG: hypothetical protein OJF58_000022 [Enhydrobacter sp.]
MRRVMILLATAAGIAASAGPASAAGPVALTQKQQAAVREAVTAALDDGTAPARFGKMAAVRTPVGSVIVCGLVRAGGGVGGHEGDRTYLVLVTGSSARLATMGGGGARGTVAASQCAQYGMNFAADTVAAR